MQGRPRRSSSGPVSKQVNYIGVCAYCDGCYGPDRGQDEDDADEERPGAGPDVDEEAELPHVPWARYEFAKDEFTAGVLLEAKVTTWEHTYKMGIQ